MNTSLAHLYLQELEAEAPASRKCLERLPAESFDFKPQEKSMRLGYVALMVAEIPRWISTGIEESIIDFGTFGQKEFKSGADLVALLDKNMKKVREVLEKTSDEDLEAMFTLKNNGQELMSMSKKDMLSSSINHWIHHRGQLTVYMRMKDIPVPSIYGPSGDEGGF